MFALLKNIKQWQWVFASVFAGLSLGAQAQEVLAPGWPKQGVVDGSSPEYLVFLGSGQVTGTVSRRWVESLDASPEGTLIFEPDAASRKAHPLLHQYIDLGATEINTINLGLPYKMPPDTSVCGYKMKATLLLGPYYKYNVGHSGGYDVAKMNYVIRRGPAREIRCEPDDVRLNPYQAY